VAQHERGFDDETPDAPMLVVVSVGPAHSDGADPDEDLTRTGPGNGPLLDDDVPGSAKYGRSHLQLLSGGELLDGAEGQTLDEFVLGREPGDDHRQGLIIISTTSGEAECSTGSDYS
jgi:hypothetical protein